MFMDFVFIEMSIFYYFNLSLSQEGRSSRRMTLFYAKPQKTALNANPTVKLMH